MPTHRDVPFGVPEVPTDVVDDVIEGPGASRIAG